jgi:hypothetical protein
MQFRKEREMSKKLFIIGNGFDVHHGIPSKYSYFGKYLTAVDTRSWQTINEYLHVDKDFWACFEERLASFDEDAVIDYAEKFLVGYGADDWSDADHHNFEYEIEQIVDALSRKLRDHFSAWIRQLSSPASGSFSTVRSIDSNALYLTFNYTPTLENVYSVPSENVLHIHGNATIPTDQIIIGHGWERLDEEKLSSNIDEDTDTRVAGGYRLIDVYFAETFKPTDFIIGENGEFFDSISDTEDVFVLGHSLSDVDSPYIYEVIRKISPSAKWIVSYHDNLELQMKRLEGLGVALAQAKFCQLSHL